MEFVRVITIDDVHSNITTTSITRPIGRIYQSETLLD